MNARVESPRVEGGCVGCGAVSAPVRAREESEAKWGARNGRECKGRPKAFGGMTATAAVLGASSAHDCG